MNAGKLTIKVVSDLASRGSARRIAVAEVAPRNSDEKPVRFTVGTRSARDTLSLPEGEYVVRLYQPSGAVQSRLVRVQSGEAVQLLFNSEPRLRHRLGSSDTNTLSNVRRKNFQEIGRSKVANFLVRSGASMPVPGAVSFGPAVAPEEKAEGVTNDLSSRIEIEWRSLSSSVDASVSDKAWRWVSRVDWERSLNVDLSTQSDVLRWWTGSAIAPPSQMRRIPDLTDDEVRFRSTPSERLSSDDIRNGSRAFAAVRSRRGGESYVVLPEGMRRLASTDTADFGVASVLLQKAVESTRTSPSWPGRSVQWRAIAEIDDLETTGLISFVSSSRTGAAHAIIVHAAAATRRLQNPLAVAAAAYLFVSQTAAQNVAITKDWRARVERSYIEHATSPDVAIAMAEMALKFGRPGGTDVDVDSVREYALEAVRRGLPYLTIGVGRLTEVLAALRADDIQQGRSGQRVDDTKSALQLIRRIARMTISNEIFTTVRLKEDE